MFNNETNQTKKVRFEWIDALRAMAIIFVIYGHCGPGENVFYVFTSPVKMPMFFILSGFLFNLKGGDVKKYLYGTWMKLIVPWLLLSAIALIPSCAGMLVKQNFSGIAERVWAVLMGVDHWLMPCFIIGYVLHFAIRKFVKSEYVRCAISIACFFAGVTLKEHDILNVCMINRAISVQLFFYIGYIVKENFTLILSKRKLVIVAGVLLYLLGCAVTMIMYPGQCMDVHMCYYYNIGICLLLIIIGNISAISIATMFNRIPKWLTFIGRNSLVIYMLQGFGFILITGLVKVMKIDVTSLSQPLWAFVKMIIIISLCSLISMVINRFAPIVTGGRK